PRGASRRGGPGCRWRRSSRSRPAPWASAGRSTSRAPTRRRRALPRRPRSPRSAAPTRSRLPPAIAARLQKRVGLARSPTAGLVARERSVLLAPAREDRIDEGPLRLDLVGPREERRVAAHGIEDQSLVGLGRA